MLVSVLFVEVSAKKPLTTTLRLQQPQLKERRSLFPTTLCSPMLYDSTSPSNTNPFLYSSSQSAGAAGYFHSSTEVGRGGHSPEHIHSNIDAPQSPYFDTGSLHGSPIQTASPHVLSIDTELVSGGGGPQRTTSTSSSRIMSKKRGPHLQFNANNTVPFCMSAPHLTLSCLVNATRQIVTVQSSSGSGQKFDLMIIPKIDRGFFLAEGEWTCYRRNYFQMSLGYSCQDASTGQEMPVDNINNLVISNPNDASGVSMPISGFALCVSARVATGDRKIDLVQHTPKRDKGPQIVPTPRKLANGGNPHNPYAMASNGTSGASGVTTFERMQFKTATANNGKRRAAQQFYVLVIELYAISAWDGSFVLAGYAESNSLVVRGRSPGHYVEGGSQRQRQHHQNHSGMPASPVQLHGSPMTQARETSPQTPLSSFSSPMSFAQATPKMLETSLATTFAPMDTGAAVASGLLAHGSGEDAFVVSQQNAAGAGYGSRIESGGGLDGYGSTEYLNQTLWNTSGQDEYAEEAGLQPIASFVELPLTPPKSTGSGSGHDNGSLFYNH